MNIMGKRESELLRIAGYRAMLQFKKKKKNNSKFVKL